MVIGHLTATYALAGPLGRRYPALNNIPPLLIGAYLPDLIDKPLNLIAGIPGRGPGHSAVLLAIAFYLLIRILPARRSLLIPLAAGAFLHLAQDLVNPVVFLWPFLGSWEDYGRFVLMENLSEYYLNFRNPGMLALEVVSYPFFAYALLRRRPAETIEGEAAPASTEPEASAVPE